MRSRQRSRVIISRKIEPLVWELFILLKQHIKSKENGLRTCQSYLATNEWILPNLHSSSTTNLRMVRNEVLWWTEHDGSCDTYFIKCFLTQCSLLHIPNAVWGALAREMRDVSFLMNSPFHVWWIKFWFTWQSQSTFVSIFPLDIYVKVYWTYMNGSRARLMNWFRIF